MEFVFLPVARNCRCCGRRCYCFCRHNIAVRQVRNNSRVVHCRQYNDYRRHRLFYAWIRHHILGELKLNFELFNFRICVGHGKIKIISFSLFRFVDFEYESLSRSTSLLGWIVDMRLSNCYHL